MLFVRLYILVMMWNELRVDYSEILHMFKYFIIQFSKVFLPVDDFLQPSDAEEGHRTNSSMNREVNHLWSHDFTETLWLQTINKTSGKEGKSSLW